MRWGDRGSKNKSAKLTEEQVLEIKRDLLAGVHFREVAKKFDVSASTIYNIKVGHTWSHLKLTPQE